MMTCSPAHLKSRLYLNAPVVAVTCAAAAASRTVGTDTHVVFVVKVVIISTVP